jgi:glycosyltransferase involved in cell wall biosynthesis
MPDAPRLSLIVPVYNGADQIAANLERIVGVLTEIERSFEVIVVCDGCTDSSADAARTVADARLRVLSYERNRGKGYAICTGITQAHGQLIGWLDADLDVNPNVILDAVRRFDSAQVDAVVGSKRHAASRVSYPLVRRVLSAGFQLLVWALFNVNVRDTQVGAKVFSREMIATIAPLLLIKRYAFDLEVLAVGAEFGFNRVEEVPIELDYRFTGTGITQAAVWGMFQDMLALAYRIHIRHWYPRQFAANQYLRSQTRAPEIPVGAPSSMWAAIAAASVTDDASRLAE